MIRCASCPCAPGVECLSTRPEFAYFCDWARSNDPVRRAHVAGRSALGLLPATARGQSTLPPPALSETDLLRTMTCPWQRLSSCACGKPYECALSGLKRRAEDCRACLYGFVPARQLQG